MITYFGLVRADDTIVAPTATTKEGYPIYERGFGSGFSLVVEGRRGGTNADIERRTFLWNPGDPATLPGLHVITSATLGNGSVAVCDDLAPMLGGVPAIEPFDFNDGSQVFADAVNDLSCRFKDGSGQRLGREADSACTLSSDGLFRFVDPTSAVQFCGLVNSAIEFPRGDTTLVARIRDTAGNLSVPRTTVIRIVAE